MPFISIRFVFAGRAWMLALVLAGFLLAIAAPKPAWATPVTTTIHFQASDFGDGAPTDPVIGSVSLVFDANGGEVLDQPVIDIDLTIGDHVYLADEVGFNYSSSLSGGQLTIGAKINGIELLENSDKDDFAILITNTMDGLPEFEKFIYAIGVDAVDVQAFALFSSSTSSSSVTVSIVNTGIFNIVTPFYISETGNVAFVVPEPSTLPLLGVGLLGLVALRRRLLPVEQRA